jgi:hypothetical protein
VVKLPQQRLVDSVTQVCADLGGDDPLLVVVELGDDTLLSTLDRIAEAQRALQVLAAVVTAEVSRRSDRRLGYDGLAQRKGHRTGTDLVQAVTGQTRADVRRATDSGNDLRAAALRPRRGPRFRDNSGSEASTPAAEDSRSNAQLEYDTVLAILRTGAAADPAQAFGDRQPGIRIVVPLHSLVERDVADPPVGVAFAEETSQAPPASIAERYACDAGTRPMTIASDGAPLDVGRDKRLFTHRQRVALALRDGGCIWCGAEPYAVKRIISGIGTSIMANRPCRWRSALPELSHAPAQPGMAHHPHRLDVSASSARRGRATRLEVAVASSPLRQGERFRHDWMSAPALEPAPPQPGFTVRCRSGSALPFQFSPAAGCEPAGSTSRVR